MDTITNALFWIYFIYFILAVIIAFFIPGNLLLRNRKLNFFQELILSIVVGMVLWCWQGFIFGYLGLRWLTYIYLLITILFWLRFNFLNFTNFKIPTFKNFDFLLAFILLCGITVQLLSTFFVGVLETKGLYFCCGLPDSLYHLNLTNQIIKQIPPIEPGASEIIVVNYHYWGNILVAELVRIFRLPLIFTQYQYIVLLFSFLFGIVPLVFSQLINADKKFTYWLLFFLYFSGDITYMLFFILGKGLNFSLPFLENGVWLWISPPRVMAAVVFFGSLSIFVLWLKKKEIYLGILLSILFSSLIGLKIYFGLFVLSGLGGLGIYYMFKKQFYAILPIILTFLLSVLIYLLISNSSGGLIFTGLWRFQDFIVSPGLELSRLELERQIYLSHSNWPRLLEYTVIYAFIYIVFVFGTLNIGFLQTNKSLKILGKEINIFLITGIIISLTMGSLFIQRVGGANSSQFLITVEIISSIYAALAVVFAIKKLGKKIKLAMILIIISLTIPRVGYETYNNIQLLLERRGFWVSNQELQALKYIKDNTEPDACILVNNVDRGNWRNAFSNYIGFLSNRQIYVDGNGIAQDHGVSVENKIFLAENIFTSSDPVLVKKLLTDSKIDYIYMASQDNFKIDGEKNYLIPFFQNEKVKIYKVSKK